MISLGLKVKNVICHPYRTANIANCFMEADRHDENVHDFEIELASVVGVRIDNHTCYTIILDDGSKIYYMFSDFKMYVGLRLIERNW